MRAVVAVFTSLLVISYNGVASRRRLDITASIEVGHDTLGLKPPSRKRFNISDINPPIPHPPPLRQRSKKRARSSSGNIEKDGTNQASDSHPRMETKEEREPIDAQTAQTAPQMEVTGDEETGGPEAIGKTTEEDDGLETKGPTDDEESKKGSGGEGEGGDGDSGDAGERDKIEGSGADALVHPWNNGDEKSTKASKDKDKDKSILLGDSYSPTTPPKIRRPQRKNDNHGDTSNRNNTTGAVEQHVSNSGEGTRKGGMQFGFNTENVGEAFKAFIGMILLASIAFTVGSRTEYLFDPVPNRISSDSEDTKTEIHNREEKTEIETERKEPKASDTKS